MQKVKLSGLTCAACQKVIERRLKKIPGVQEATVQLSGLTEINAGRTIGEEEITKVLEDTQFNIINI